ncbi:hypothetical protein JXC34_07170 [Candidatus Woesearchaeota archaeon]|nr:hypothetical protein [Candidatus Woesearchaeota archaeon]
MTKAWVVSVDMGYGHQRAAYPLKDIAFEKIITANSDKIISYDEKKLWEKTRNFYEFISRLKHFPLLGPVAFGLFNKTMEISPFFPFRDLSKPTLSVLFLKKQILKKGLCKSLIEHIKRKDLPLIVTHPIPAMAAHYLGVKKIFCVATDTDIARAWVIDNPKENTITYFAPCVHVAVRLREYGISEDKIILTGFPLPKENIGGKSCPVLKKDLGNRLTNLDPNKVFIKTYKETLRKKMALREKSDHPLTIAYMVGGAGAEADIGLKILKSLKEKIMKGDVRINLVAGTRLNVVEYYLKGIKSIELEKYEGKNIRIIYGLDKRSYFSNFNDSLHTTDIIWTKPSEMSFYTGLGLPVIIAPPIGAHEHYNEEWLNHIGSGFIQKDPEYTSDWLYYWLENGRLAEAAWEGWIEAPVLGTYKIEEHIQKHS